MPEKKVTAATLGAAVTTIVVWILRTFLDIDIPIEVASAMSIVVVAIAGYFAPHTHRPDLVGPAEARTAEGQTTG
jgi:hypothetical protein